MRNQSSSRLALLLLSCSPRLSNAYSIFIASKESARTFSTGTSLQAASVVNAIPSEKVAWHQRVFGTVFRRGNVQIHADGASKTQQQSSVYSRSFIQDNFELGMPASLMELETINEESALYAASFRPPISPYVPVAATRGPSPLTRLTENVLANLFDNWSKGDHQDMDIRCDLQSNWRQVLFRGNLCCNAQIDFQGPINFNAIRLSGGRLQARQLALNIFSFCPQRLRKRPRYPQQFLLEAQDATLTSSDLMQSPCIRNGLRRLLTRILNGRGMNTMFVAIDDMAVLESDQLSVKGTATTILGQRVPFEVRTGLSFEANGHVLTFPGLALSLSGFFVPVLPEITVDLGPTAQLLDVRLDGTSRTLKLGARVTITPEHTTVGEATSERSTHGAQCSVDVGRWLTRLGRFSL